MYRINKAARGSSFGDGIFVAKSVFTNPPSRIAVKMAFNQGSRMALLQSFQKAAGQAPLIHPAPSRRFKARAPPPIRATRAIGPPPELPTLARHASQVRANKSPLSLFQGQAPHQHAPMPRAKTAASGVCEAGCCAGQRQCTGVLGTAPQHMGEPGLRAWACTEVMLLFVEHLVSKPTSITQAVLLAQVIRTTKVLPTLL